MALYYETRPSGEEQMMQPAPRVPTSLEDQFAAYRDQLESRTHPTTRQQQARLATKLCAMELVNSLDDAPETQRAIMIGLLASSD